MIKFHVIIIKKVFLYEIREMIYNEAKKIKTDIDAESLAAIATYYISQNDYFKSTYSHFNMITNGKRF